MFGDFINSPLTSHYLKLLIFCGLESKNMYLLLMDILLGQKLGDFQRICFKGRWLMSSAIQSPLSFMGICAQGNLCEHFLTLDVYIA